MDTYWTSLPLRKVTEVYRGEKGSIMERLECGHGAYAPVNPYSGYRPAKRRRCWQCKPLAALHIKTERQARQDAKDGRRYV